MRDHPKDILFNLNCFYEIATPIRIGMGHFVMYS